MTRIIRSISAPLLVLLACAAWAYAAADIDGRWKGTVNGPEGPIELILDLKATGEVLSGSATFPMFPEMPISNGKVTATQVSFDLVFAEASFTLPFRGHLTGETLKLGIEGPAGVDSISFVRAAAN